MTTATVDLPSAPRQREAGSPVDAADPCWKPLYLVGGVAALLSVVLMIAAIGAHLAWPPPAWTPGAAVAWFARFGESWLLGLVGLDLMIILGLVLGLPVTLALYVALRPAGQSMMLVATAMALLATVLHLVSNTAFEMLVLSNAYAVATTDLQRAAYVAAGEAMLAAYNGTSFHVSYILGYVTRILIGAVMLRSAFFGKATAYLALLSGLVGLGLYLPTVGLLLSLISVVLIAVWNILIGRRLIQLGRRAS